MRNASRSTPSRASRDTSASTCEVDGGKVQRAWSSGQMFRGIETILLGRDPRDAWMFTQRFCGVCTTVHAIASVRAVENALRLEIPMNAQYIRNLIVMAHAMHDHIVHFYQLSALDWVDVVSALKADPAKASALAESLSPWPGNSKEQLKAVQDKVKTFVEAGQLGIFTNGYWGHPAMKLPPEVNLLAVAHYLQALEYQRKVNQVVTILGGKTPNIQNLAVGGVANAINLDNEATLNMNKLFMVKDVLDQMTAFIEQVYFVDVCAIGAMYPDWLGYGAGVTNYLAVPDLPLDAKGTKFDLPGRNDLRRRPLDGPGDQVLRRSLLQGQRHRVDRPRVVRRRVDQAPVRGRHGAEVHQVRRREEVLVGQGAALRGQGHAGRAAGAGARRLRPRPRADQALGGQDARNGRRRGEDEALAGRPALDARPARRAHDPHVRDLASSPGSTGPCSSRTSARGTRPSSTSRCSRRASSADSASTRRRAGRCRIGS